MQYWGVADISRLEAINKLQGKFFSLSADQIIKQLRSDSNPTRYWVFERDGRKCSQCGALAMDEKLHVACKERGYLYTIDNLTSNCQECAEKSKSEYCE